MDKEAVMAMTEIGRRYISPGISRLSEEIVIKAHGCVLETASGLSLLDFSAGIGVVNTGHCHPRVVAAVQEQAAKAMHVQVNIIYHEPMLSLLPLLHSVMPSPSLDTFFFWNSGAEAVEAAVKLARQATHRPYVIVVQGSYHGRTMGTMAMTTSKSIYRAGFSPLMANVLVTPFPYCRQLPAGMSDDDMVSYCLDQLELLLVQQANPNEVACLVVEPVLGEGGYVPAPKAFMQGLQRVCNSHDILLVVDEVQTGFGRTGKMFAVEHSGIVPDILVMAKGLASGMPLSCIAARKELMDKQPGGSMGGTYAGNAVACAAARATIQVIKEENLLDRAAARGAQLVNGLKRLKARYPIRDVRGLGLMVAVELDGPKGAAGHVSRLCLERGLVVLTASVFETLRLMPPLTVSCDEIEKAVTVIEEALEMMYGRASGGVQGV